MSDIESQIADLRPILTRTLHALCPEIAMIDCARLANRILDAVEDGNVAAAKAMRELLDVALTGQSAPAQI